MGSFLAREYSLRFGMDKLQENGRTSSSHMGTRGGVLIAVDEDYYNISQSEVREHTVSVHVTSKQYAKTWG